MIATYRRQFQPSRAAAGVSTPTLLIAVRLVIGETQDEAERLAMPMRAIFKLRRKHNIFVEHIPSIEEATEIMGGHIPAEDVDWPGYVVGTPERVKAMIGRMSELTGVTEFMVQDFLDDPDLRLRNYALLLSLSRPQQRPNAATRRSIAGISPHSTACCARFATIQLHAGSIAIGFHRPSLNRALLAILSAGIEGLGSKSQC